MAIPKTDLLCGSAILTRMNTFEAPLSHLGAPAMIHNASQALSTTSLPNSPQPESRPLGQLVVGTPSDATAPVAGTLVTSQNGSAARLGVKRKPPQTSYTRFRVQPWLLNQVWEFGLHRATRGWDVKLRAYRVVPKDNELFQACTLGRIEEVRSILISGKISAYDKDGNGQDTLTVSQKQESVRVGLPSHDISENHMCLFHEWSRLPH